MRRALLPSSLFTSTAVVVALAAAPRARAQAPVSTAFTAVSTWPGPIIQNRKHRLGTELTFGPSLLPSDAYSKEAGLSLSITRYFTRTLGWEIVHAHGYLDWRSSIRAQLEDNFGVPPQRFAVLRAALDSNFVWSPLYAKFSLLNKRLLYLQLSLLAGGGLGLVQGGEPEPDSDLPGRGLHLAVLMDVGLSLRLWLSERWSLRYDLRQYLSIDTANDDVRPPLFMSLTLSVNLGGGQ